MDQSVKELGTRREETIKVRGESDRAATFFSKLADESDVQRRRVLDVDLDAPAPGAH